MKIFKFIICLLFCLLQILLISCNFNEKLMSNDTIKISDTNEDPKKSTSQSSEEKNVVEISTDNLTIGGDSNYCCHNVMLDENISYDNSYN